MKKEAILLLLLLVACQPVADQPEITYEEPVEQEPPRETREQEPQPQKIISDKLESVLDRNQKVNDYRYLFRYDEVKNVYVDLPKIRIEYSNLQNYNDFKYYDIYIQREDKTAFLVCDDVEECKGVKVKEVDFDEFNIQTPLEVIRELEYGEITESTQIENKDTVVVSWTYKGHPERMWVWEFWGMPIKREIQDKGQLFIVEYDNLVVGPLDIEMPEVS